MWDWLQRHVDRAKRAARHVYDRLQPHHRIHVDLWWMLLYGMYLAVIHHVTRFDHRDDRDDPDLSEGKKSTGHLCLKIDS